MEEHGITDGRLLQQMYGEAGTSTDNEKDRHVKTCHLYYSRMEIEAMLAMNPAPAVGEGEGEARRSGVASGPLTRGIQVHEDAIGGGGSGEMSSKKKRSRK